MPTLPVIPSSITVHLGPPSSNAENVTVPFTDYIKNVASSEIFSTWPPQALRANILAQITFALNRVYTEWYRAMGYDFDITNSTAFDQSFVNGRNIYENISETVDEIFNDYVRKEGTVNPYFTAYCDGREVTCDGLSQWGSVSLAERGYSDVDILKYYYGEDTEIVVNAPVGDNLPSYPGTPLEKGQLNENIRRIQIYLNRISANYPAIPKIPVINGAFDESTEDAVRAFQRIFSLAADGIVGKATWYRIIYIYDAVTRIAELDSEGIGYENIPKQFTGSIGIGAQGGQVVTVQFFLSLISQFVDFVAPVNTDGVYGQNTANQVSAFQRYKGLPVTGEVDRRTWESLYDAYKGIVDYLEDRQEIERVPTQPYPGVVLRQGDTGPSVAVFKGYLSYLSRIFFDIPPVSQNNVFDRRTQNAVREFQRIFSLPQTGTVDERTWNTLADAYSTVREGQQRLTGQYPGRELSQEA